MQSEKLVKPVRSSRRYISSALMADWTPFPFRCNFKTAFTLPQHAIRMESLLREAFRWEWTKESEAARWRVKDGSGGGPDHICQCSAGARHIANTSGWRDAHAFFDVRRSLNSIADRAKMSGAARWRVHDGSRCGLVHTCQSYTGVRHISNTSRWRDAHASDVK